MNDIKYEKFCGIICIKINEKTIGHIYKRPKKRKYEVTFYGNNQITFFISRTLKYAKQTIKSIFESGCNK